MICPSCNSDLNFHKTICPVCNFDLTVLLKFIEMPDYYFNQALEAYSKKDYFSAIEFLSIVKLFNPSDVEAINLLGAVYTDLGNYTNAASNFIKVLKIDSKNSDAKKYLFWLKKKGCEIPIEVLFS